MSPTNLDGVAAIHQNKLDDKSLSMHDIGFDLCRIIAAIIARQSARGNLYSSVEVALLTGTTFGSVESVNGYNIGWN